MKYLFPEELRKFGFVPVSEWTPNPVLAFAVTSPVMYSNGAILVLPHSVITATHAKDAIIAVQVAPVPCEKVKVWTFDRTSYGEVRLCRNRSTYTTLYDTMYKTDAQAQELCDLLERQEG